MGFPANQPFQGEGGSGPAGPIAPVRGPRRGDRKEGCPWVAQPIILFKDEEEEEEQKEEEESEEEEESSSSSLVLFHPEEEEEEEEDAGEAGGHGASLAMLAQSAERQVAPHLLEDPACAFGCSLHWISSPAGPNAPEQCGDIP